MTLNTISSDPILYSNSIQLGSPISFQSPSFCCRRNMFSPKQNPLFSPTNLTPSIVLTMEVSFPFHSRLIGTSGKNVTNLMNVSGTRIHFPDRNRISGQTKSNGVDVQGQLANLENARQLIRASIPPEFEIECREDYLSGKLSLLKKYFSKTYGVLLRFYPKTDGVNCQVNIRGLQNGIELLKQAVTYLGCITQTSVEHVLVKIETSFDHAWIIKDHVDKIKSASGIIGIKCPDVSNLKELPQKYTIWIRGSMDSVLLANSLLSGLLPMQLMIQISYNRLDPILLKLLADAQKADISYHVEPFDRETVKIRLASYEWNADNLFLMTGSCLGLPEIVKPCLPPAWLELAGNIARNSFFSAAQKLMNKIASLSSSHQRSLPLSSGPVVQILKSSLVSSRSSVTSSFTMPTSLTGSRFDPNSFRQLSELLETVGLSRYSEDFLSNEVDMAMFTTLTHQDLVSIGIKNFGARRVMLEAIEELRKSMNLEQ